MRNRIKGHKQKKSVFLKIGFFIILFFGILEIGLRQTNKLKTYSEKNFGNYQSPYSKTLGSHLLLWKKNDSFNIKQSEFSYRYVTNQYGIADKHKLDTCKKENTILVIGDSFVFGVGANQESSLTSFLENKTNYTFINAGIPGSDPFFEVKLDKYLKNINYSKIIMLINFSDINDYIFRGGNERFLENGSTQYRKAPWFEKFYQHSFIIRAFVNGVLKYDYTLLNPKMMIAEKKKAIQEYNKLLSSYNKTLRNNKQELLIVLQPYARQYANNNKILSEVLNYEYLNKLEKELTKYKVKTINLNEEMNSVINAENYLDYSWEIDGHYNAKGYEIMANSIIKELEKNYPNFLE